MRRCGRSAETQIRNAMRVVSLIAASCLWTPAQADEYGCQVLLCLSNPSGPMAESECRPPIERMLRELAQKRPPPFPRCEEAQGKASAVPGSSPYEPCPEGSVALPTGQTATLGKRTPAGGIAMPTQAESVVYVGSGEGDAPVQFGSTPASKVCVGRLLGTANFVSGVGDASTIVPVDVYDFIATLDAVKGSSWYVDVLIDGRQYRRVRF